VRTPNETAADERIGVFLRGQEMNRLVHAGRQLSLNVVTRDPVQKLLLVSHRLVNRVSMRRETLQLRDRSTVTIAAIATSHRSNRLRAAEREHKGQGGEETPMHHINLRHDLHHSVNHIAATWRPRDGRQGMPWHFDHNFTKGRL
jgi:hypothetical protein